ncbi:MAG TPA: CRTAC1 family protein [Candidatus Polarisedimenticolaceae bacterium]|nr:CRTAC1 family protein [Candidatus Polarisedimenticolaceae bacterium]
MRRVLALAVLGVACAGPPEHLRFVDVAQEAGLTRIVVSGRPGKDHLLDSAGTGVAWLDYDRDGWLDAYIVNGWKGKNALYRNRGDGTFEDVTDRAGVGGEARLGAGVAVADYDGDDWPDLFVTNFGRNLLYRNRGDGTFVDEAERAGVTAPGWNTGAAFFDADGDGDLDLYVAAYIDCTLEEVLAAQRTLDWKGVEQVAFGPFGLRGAADHFFRSDGHGRFTEATEESGLTDRARAYGFGVRAADFDDDGDLDLYVANDSDANYLYRNDGAGKFQEIGLWSGAAFDANGAAQASMGVTVGDADGDGRLDIFVTNFAEDFSTLYRGEGGGFFRDVSAAAGVGQPTYNPLSWGTAFADLDNDADLDLVVINGHIYPQVDRHPELGQHYAQAALLLENDGRGQFHDVTAQAGPGFATPRPGRGLAVGDYDNDGDLDLLLTQLDGPPALLRNESACASWLRVTLRVPPGRGTAIGARVLVRAGGRVQQRDASSGESYLSVHDPRLHFGLGAAETVDEVEVRWPDGTRTVRPGLRANQAIEIVKP